MATSDSTTYSIYRIVCFPTGKCYIGRSIHAKYRKTSHFNTLRRGIHHSAHLQRAYDKYGESSFYFEVLESNIPKADVSAREGWWVNHFDSFNNGYNMTEGGETYTIFGQECWWNGIPYVSITECARANGITESSMFERLSKGYTCDTDLGRPTKDVIPKPCTIHGVTYSSYSEAARANNVTLTTIRRWVRNGYTKPEDIPLGRRRVVIWEGKEYRSISQAARATGMSVEAMRRRIDNGCLTSADVDARRHRTPCIVNGIEYVSKKQAAVALGIPYDVFVRRLRKRTP